jgi:hypothetical protein
MNKYSLNSEDKNLLKYLILHGTSDFCRLRLWLICSGSQNEIRLNPTYYNDLLNLSKEVPSLYANDIEKDLDRTNQVLLSEKTVYKEMLRNILICYSIRNSSIGYCQGFNFIVLRIIEIAQNEVIFILFIFEFIIIGICFLDICSIN